MKRDELEESAKSFDMAIRRLSEISQVGNAVHFASGNDIRRTSVVSSRRRRSQYVINEEPMSNSITYANPENSRLSNNSVNLLSDLSDVSNAYSTTRVSIISIESTCTDDHDIQGIVTGHITRVNDFDNIDAQRAFSDSDIPIQKNYILHTKYKKVSIGRILPDPQTSVISNKKPTIIKKSKHRAIEATRNDTQCEVNPLNVITDSSIHGGYSQNNTYENTQNNTHGNSSNTNFTPSRSPFQGNSYLYSISSSISSLKYKESRSRSTSHVNHFTFNLNLLPIRPNMNEHFNLNELTGMRHLIDGSNSNVFKAMYDKTIPIIVKYMMRDPPNRDVAKNEFALEHQILMRISHPNVVGYYGGGVGDDKRPFLCLEILTGGSLASIMNNPNRNSSRSPFSTKRVLEIAFQFADALNYLHTGYHPDVTLIHRDLKPDNIGFTDKGMLKLMDFGLCACVRRRQDMDQTYAMTGNTGSIRYMAPEVLQSLPYNEMVDIYSFGIILWQMATGQTPYQGLTMADFFTRVVEQKVRPLIEPYVRCISKPLANIITSCWDADYKMRHSAGNAVNLLTALLEAEPVAQSACMPCSFLFSKG